MVHMAQPVETLHGINEWSIRHSHLKSSLGLMRVIIALAGTPIYILTTPMFRCINEIFCVHPNFVNIRVGGGEMECSNAETMSDADARLGMMELANMLSVPMALNAAVKLNIAQVIWQGGLNKPMTATEITSRLLNKPPSEVLPNAANFQRILRMLCSYKVFTEMIDDREGERRYSVGAIGKTLIRDEDGCSYGAYVLQHHQDSLISAWQVMDRAVTDPQKEPFAWANGKPAYMMYGDDPESNKLMLDAMIGVSLPFMRALLGSDYNGFDGVKSLVDVGGSSGFCLHMILQRHPHISEAINFDLPYVVQGAPTYPGVTHVGGDMFQEIPSAEAIFMKWILATWNDEKCIEILKSCHSALPHGGKVIACEPVLPKHSNCDRRSRALLEGDIFVMTIYSAGGKERTNEEFQQLSSYAGFSKLLFIEVDPFYTVLEFHK